VLTALDRLEQEGFPLPPDLLVGGQRRLEIREDAARDGDEIPLRGQLQKVIKLRRVHVVRESLAEADRAAEASRSHRQPDSNEANA